MEYQPGEEILEGEEPFSHIIKSQFRSEFCDWCIKKGDPNEEVILKKCTACKEVSYCNRDCQRKAFSAYHKQECSKLKTIPQGNLLFKGYCHQVGCNSICGTRTETVPLTTVSVTV